MVTLNLSAGTIYTLGVVSGVLFSFIGLVVIALFTSKKNKGAK
jgi:hypothetical protein